MSHSSWPKASLKPAMGFHAALGLVAKPRRKPPVPWKVLELDGARENPRLQSSLRVEADVLNAVRIFGAEILASQRVADHDPLAAGDELCNERALEVDAIGQVTIFAAHEPAVGGYPPRFPRYLRQSAGCTGDTPGASPASSKASRPRRRVRSNSARRAESTSISSSVASHSPRIRFQWCRNELLRQHARGANPQTGASGRVVDLSRVLLLRAHARDRTVRGNPRDTA